MERDINVEAADANAASILHLGSNDSPYKLYINGKKIAAGQQKNIVVTVPANTFHAGKNVLLLKQGAQLQPDWMGMGIHGEKDEVFIQFQSHDESLADYEWRMMPVFGEPYFFAKLNNSVAASMYNGMIHPIINYALKGVLWYQGESNTSRAFQYRTTFPLLIHNWRSAWKDSLPFYFVQLSSFGSNQSSNEGSDWAELREAQTMALQILNTGMAVTTDIGNAADIHPTNKQDVGRRLAAIALHQLYGVDTSFGGPLYQSVSFTGEKAVVHFLYADKGLMAKDTFGYVKGFEVAGDDKKFYYAQAFIKGNTIEVVSKDVPNPVAVRYAWSNAPTEANLYNVEGFPASPFRTDNWVGKTDTVRFK